MSTVDLARRHGECPCTHCKRPRGNHFSGNCAERSAAVFQCADCGQGPEETGLQLPCPHIKQAPDPEASLEARHEAALALIGEQQRQLDGLREAVHRGMITEFSALFHKKHEKSRQRLDKVLDAVFKREGQA